MKRIGIAASRMSKGNLAVYNAYVIVISILFSLFIFVVAGVTVVFSLVILIYVGEEVMGASFKQNLSNILPICLGTLTVVVTLFNAVAIIKNIRLPKPKKHDAIP